MTRWDGPFRTYRNNLMNSKPSNVEVKIFDKSGKLAETKTYNVTSENLPTFEIYGELGKEEFEKRLSKIKTEFEKSIYPEEKNEIPNISDTKKKNFLWFKNYADAASCAKSLAMADKAAYKLISASEGWVVLSVKSDKN